MTAHLSISGLQEFTYCDSILMTCVLSQLKLPFTHDPAVSNAHCVQVGGQRGRLGWEQWVHHGSAAEGPEGFPLEELVCPRRVIKMEICFDKDTLGHFFPTELGQSPAVQRYVKKT